MDRGCVFWITGLAGAGKSTIGRLFFHRWKKKKEKVLLLDGDELRATLGIEGHYSYEERKTLAFTYCRLCKMIADQGHDVIISTISLFHDCHQWNRQNQPCYYEIYLRVPIPILNSRNHNNLYATGTNKVVGIDIPFEEPMAPNLIFENYGGLSPDQVAEQIYLHAIGRQ